ncbi:MAG: HD domain-containing protein [Ruminococcus sp.]
MDRVNKIIHNSRYQELIAELNFLEKDRKFCKHTMEHFLDTARIMYIISLENNLNISKDVIYACALLHDIGRVAEYKQGKPHNESSAGIARGILKACDYSDKEINDITKAILFHRAKDCDNILGKLLYKADKLSRLCFCCYAESECYWDKEKKNFDIIL